MLTIAKTHVGKIRENNEDSIFTTEDKIGRFDNLFVVADGMGGHNAGEVASMAAIEYLKEYLQEIELDIDIEGTIMDSVFSANQKVHNLAKSEESKKGMGTTITLCTIKDNTAYFGHVGDTRAYIIRGKIITQLTKDHTYVFEMMQKGLMTKEQALSDPNRNMITRAIGIEPTVMVDISKTEVKRGDFILLCSDGLSGLVSEESILDTICNDNIDLVDKCDCLINSALENGGTDNVSVILIYV